MTSNSERYHFADFTRDQYRALLQEAKKHYSFTTYTEFSSKERHILWRHDVDFSMHCAARLAEIERAEGVTATYFLHLHSEFYNLLEPEVFEKVNAILEMGHQIGVHFDPHFYKAHTIGEIERWLKFECNFLQELFARDIKVFSFHNTDPFILSCQAATYGGLINTYATQFQKEVGYVSDSYGIWRYRRLKDVLEKAEECSLQVLTHPEYWTTELLSPKEKVMRCIDGRADGLKIRYETFLREREREFIDW